MATLTYDPTPADQPEFTPEEQESIKVGEAQLEAEQQMLAGKFRDAEELEKAYIELQQKLGERDGESEEPQLREQEETTEEEVNPMAEALQGAANEYAQTGELSEDTYKALTEMSSEDLLKTYLELQGNQPEADEAPDFTDEQVAEVKNFVGGEQQYETLVNWASENMPKNFIDAFDDLINTGSTDMIKLAVAGLNSAYEIAFGSDGQTFTGKGGVDAADVFRSQAEVVQAMADPRYDRDPAYRQDVFDKLNRSNIDY